MSKFLFALETILTSQGWFNAGEQLPAVDLPDEEAETLIKAEQAATCHHASPLAAAVHAARKQTNKAQASVDLKRAVKQLSAEEPEQSSDGEPFVDPTPAGEFPTLEIYVQSGYQAAGYEESKRQFYEDKARSESNPDGGTTDSKDETKKPESGTTTEQS